MNPYSNLPDHHFWRRSVSNKTRHEFDPVVSVKFTVSAKDRVATAGSCFAQHISRRLSDRGFNYFVTESGERLSPGERKRLNFGVFSARYGNIYTARQLRQLFEEAFNGRERAERAWQRPDGRFVDPYRPTVEPDGFADAGAVEEARRHHLTRVRALFEQTDVFVFTLGLTEAWLSKRDGAVFPLPPGVVGDSFDESRHGFANFSVAEVEQDLRHFLEALKSANPKVRVLLTVSPVPLLATYEPRNVLVATTYSKSVLRVAAETIARDREWVDYFPSYEIITGSFNGGMYYDDDAREVTRLGVDHVMRVFLNRYVHGIQPPSQARIMEAVAASPEAPMIVCDEEAIAAISR